MLIAGIDEAGRGPCLGPMVLCVATIEKSEEEKLIEIGVKDSKMLTAEQREIQFPKIQSILKEFRTIHIQPHEMDTLMDWKSLNEIEAMKIGYLLNSLKEKPEVAFIDSPDVIEKNFARRIRKYVSYGLKIKTEHKADVNYPIVSGASIIAKVERDAAIAELAKEFGDVGSGYPHDPKTIAFLENWIKHNHSLPHFARKAWDTNKRILDKKFQKKLGCFD